MTSFKNLKVSTKILIGNIITLVFLLIIAAYSLFELQSSIAALRNLYQQRVISLEEMGNNTRDLLQIRINMLQMLIAHEENDFAEVQRRLENSNELKAAMGQRVTKYAASELNAEEKQRLQEYRSAEDSAAESRRKFGDAVEKDRRQEALNLSRSWLNEYNKMKTAMDRLVDIQSEEAQKLFEARQEAFTQVMIVFSILLIISVAVVVLVVVVMHRFISVPLQQATERVRDLAEGEGDLTKRLEVNSADEVGEMAKWTNQFITNIHNIVKEMANNTEEVKQSSSSLTGASQNLSAGTEEMAVQSRNISAAATQMNQNFQVISSSVEELSTSVGEVARNASDASKVAREADKTATDTNQKIKQLGVDAQEIGKVVEAIQGIASQTNLLALNAAIEAAGAGEAGKGFAVVASEVKELARQAAEASDEIKHRIEAIQGSTEAAVESIAMIASVISKINEFSTSIASAVEEQSITAKEIANNVNQSAQASSDVVQNITGISTATQDGAKNAQSLAGLATQLDTLSSRLEQVVNRFKI